MIYLDYAATTPVRPEVIDAMLPYWQEHFGNPASVYRLGNAARQGLDQARRTIADLLGATPNEIVFTSGATEVCNWAIRGVMRPGDHLITSPIEHKAVQEVVRKEWQSAKGSVVSVPVDGMGRVDVADVENVIEPETRLVAIQAANNEVGTIQDFEAIGAMAWAHGVLFFTDAVQLIRFRKWDWATLPVDMMSIAPHKFGGPKGIGILVVRDGVDLRPLLFGGGQERGLRPGTSNVAFAAGAAKALELAMAEREAYTQHCIEMRECLIDGVLAAFLRADVCVTGDRAHRLPHVASFALRHLQGNDLLMHLDMAGIAASSGSACTVGNPEPSHVLAAMGFDADWVGGSLRFSVGGETTAAQVDTVISKLPKIVATLQKLGAYNE